MRLLSDENFNGEIVRGLLLRRPGLDLCRVQDVGLQESDDPAILEWAAANERSRGWRRSAMPMHPEWIEVAGGRFWLGGGPRDNENPRHEVRISPFRLARTPVTREEYQAFLDETGRAAPPFWGEPAFAHPRLPAVGPSWEDAMAFCAWNSQREGFAVRLPSEAEWEHAARAGRDALYPWGDDPPESLPGYDRRWLGGPEPVDAYPSRHPLGFLGLGENVHEWCADWYDAGYYAVSPLDDPRGPATGVRRSSRGGSWRHQIKVSRCAARSAIPPGMRYSDYGFRVAADWRRE